MIETTAQRTAKLPGTGDAAHADGLPDPENMCTKHNLRAAALSLTAQLFPHLAVRHTCTFLAAVHHILSCPCLWAPFWSAFCFIPITVFY